MNGKFKVALTPLWSRMSRGMFAVSRVWVVVWKGSCKKNGLYMWIVQGAALVCKWAAKGPEV